MQSHPAPEDDTPHVAPRYPHRALKAAVVAAAFAALGGALSLVVRVGECVLARMRLPFDIDWVESGQLYHAYRLLHDEPIYRRAVDGFLPHPYPPLHFVALAAVGRIAGLDHATGRGLSAACLAGVCALLARMMYRHARRGPFALAVAAVTVGAILRTYPYARAWYDLVRVDAIAMVFPIAAAALLCRPRVSRRSAAWAGLLLALGLYTKQTNIFFAAALVAFVATRSRRRAMELAAVVIAPSAVAFAALQAVTDGAFGGWLFQTAGHGVALGRVLVGAKLTALACPLVVTLPLFGALALFGALRPRAWRVTTRCLAWLWVAAVPAALLPFVKAFGAENNLMPLFVLSSALPVALAVDAGRRWRDRPARRHAVHLALFAASAWLFATVPFDVARFAPSAVLVREVGEMLDDVRALPGTVTCPVHPYLAVQAGKRGEQASWLALLDAWYASRPGVAREAFAAELVRRRPDWVLFANMPLERGLVDALARDYVHDHDLRGPAPDGVDLFYSIPRMAFRRRTDAERGH